MSDLTAENRAQLARGRALDMYLSELRPETRELLKPVIEQMRLKGVAYDYSMFELQRLYERQRTPASEQVIPPEPVPLNEQCGYRHPDHEWCTARGIAPYWLCETHSPRPRPERVLPDPIPDRRLIPMASERLWRHEVEKR